VPPVAGSRRNAPVPAAVNSPGSREVAMAFVIRFDDPERNPMWLRSAHPAVKWGPLADARRYRTKAAAVSATTKLRTNKKLTIEERPEADASGSSSVRR
jgi:hypothetical protein